MLSILSFFFVRTPQIESANYRNIGNLNSANSIFFLNNFHFFLLVVKKAAANWLVSWMWQLRTSLFRRNQDECREVM